MRRALATSLLVCIFAWSGATDGRAEVVHDNSDIRRNVQTLSSREQGDDVVLGGTGRTLTGIEVAFWSPYDRTSDVWLRFYRNDGVDGAPGTLIHEELLAGIALLEDLHWYSFSLPDIAVPTQFTYTIWDTSSGYGAQLWGFNPPAIGASDPHCWERRSGAWVRIDPPSGYIFNFGVRFLADGASSCEQDPADLACNTIVDAGACVQAPSGLKAWWPLDQVDAGVTPDAVGTSHATLDGEPFGSHLGVVGTGLRVDRTDQGIRVPAPGAGVVPDTGDFSLAAWVRVCDPAGGQAIVTKTRTGMSTGGFGFWLSSGEPMLTISAPGVPAQRLRSGAWVGDGCWHHVGVTIDRDDPSGVRFYVDGIAAAATHDPTPVEGGSLVNDRDLYLGNVGRIVSGLRRFALRGWIDEVQIYSRALDESEMAAVYASGDQGLCAPACVPSPSDARAWYSFDDDATIGADNMGCSDLVKAGNPQVVPGMVGNALRVTTTDFVYTSHSPCHDLVDEFSIECWIRFENSGIVYIHKATRGVGYYFEMRANRMALGLAVRERWGTFEFPQDLSLAYGTWHHLAVTVDRNSVTGGTFYVDGVATSTFDPTTAYGDIYQPTTFRIWSNPWYACDAAVDEVALYDRVLDGNEIAAVFEAGARGKCR